MFGLFKKRNKGCFKRKVTKQVWKLTKKLLKLELGVGETEYIAMVRGISPTTVRLIRNSRSYGDYLLMREKKSRGKK